MQKASRGRGFDPRIGYAAPSFARKQGDPRIGYARKQGDPRIGYASKQGDPRISYACVCQLSMEKLGPGMGPGDGCLARRVCM